MAVNFFLFCLFNLFLESICIHDAHRHTAAASRHILNCLCGICGGVSICIHACSDYSCDALAVAYGCACVSLCSRGAAATAAARATARADGSHRALRADGGHRRCSSICEKVIIPRSRKRILKAACSGHSRRSKERIRER